MEAVVVKHWFDEEEEEALALAFALTSSFIHFAHCVSQVGLTLPTYSEELKHIEPPTVLFHQGF